MKFRHISNFVPLDVNEIILEIITDHYSPTNHRDLAKLLACILLKEDVESVLERFGYVKIESAN